MYVALAEQRTSKQWRRQALRARAAASRSSALHRQPCHNMAVWASHSASAQAAARTQSHALMVWLAALRAPTRLSRAVPQSARGCAAFRLRQRQQRPPRQVNGTHQRDRDEPGAACLSRHPAVPPAGTLFSPAHRACASVPAASGFSEAGRCGCARGHAAASNQSACQAPRRTSKASESGEAAPDAQCRTAPPARSLQPMRISVDTEGSAVASAQTCPQ